MSIKEEQMRVEFEKWWLSLQSPIWTYDHIGIAWKAWKDGQAALNSLEGKSVPEVLTEVLFGNFESLEHGISTLNSRGNNSSANGLEALKFALEKLQAARISLPIIQ